MLGRRSIAALCLLVTSALALTRFTNLQCKSLDEEFCRFKTCSLKMLRRNVVGLNITLNLLKKPVNDVTVNLVLYKKSNGYKPFMVNVSADLCKFLKNREKQPLLNLLADYLLRDSNVNHTCSYNTGDYMFKLLAANHNAWKAEFKVYFQSG
ncbi:uncharacterized protein LOC142224496 [Haematobia irritans]|uniref:uncharacterized protein LOC142224496 n=1 Tax=Haematobia irritans TaxID=7368 RepID=UPI003F4FAFD8